MATHVPTAGLIEVGTHAPRLAERRNEVVDRVLLELAPRLEPGESGRPATRSPPTSPHEVACMAVPHTWLTSSPRCLPRHPATLPAPAHALRRAGERPNFGRLSLGGASPTFGPGCPTFGGVCSQRMRRPPDTVPSKVSCLRGQGRPSCRPPSPPAWAIPNLSPSPQALCWCYTGSSTMKTSERARCSPCMS